MPNEKPYVWNEKHIKIAESDTTTSAKGRAEQTDSDFDGDVTLCAGNGLVGDE